MPRLLKPRAIRAGATFGLAAPGAPIDAETLAAGEALLRGAGFRVKRRGDLTARCGYLAGDDARRVSELAELVADPEVDAILCVRGGYGCDRILDRLDPAAFRAARKPLVGYSDITALLAWQQRRAGLVGFHGPMLEHGSDLPESAFDALVAQLCGSSSLPLVLGGRGVAAGSAEGRLLGGNLTLVVASLGTPWEIDTRGAILLLEEVGERPYRVDRLMQQLRGAGKLAALAGLGVGALARCEDARYPESSAQEVICEVARPLGVPVVVDLPFGHTADNRTWPVGVRATIDGDRGEVRVLERGVTRAR